MLFRENLVEFLNRPTASVEIRFGKWTVELMGLLISRECRGEASSYKHMTSVGKAGQI